MKQTVNSSMFIDSFRKLDRFDQFGYAALNLLFDYFEGLESGMDEEMELDVIAITEV